MGPLAIVVLGGVVYYIYEKEKNPAWSPFTRLLATPVDKVIALEKVKVTSVPTPSPTVALDPHMTTDQVKQVNQTLTSETDPKKIAAHAIALGAAGHDNSAMALAAKANAVGEAKATGARDVDIHMKQLEAAGATPFEHAPVPVDAPMTACEAQVLLNVLTARQGHFDVEGVPVPLPITNAFDADTSHMIRIFQAEAHLLPTGTLDAETAKMLRIEALSPQAPHLAAQVAAGWGPVASGSGGPVATGFYGHGWTHPWAQSHDYYGWSQPWQHGFHGFQSYGWSGWPWHGFVGQRGREFEHGREHEAQEHERFGHGHERFDHGHEGGFGRGHEGGFGRGHEQFGRHEFMPQQQFGEEMMPMHHHHRRHLTREQIIERQEREREHLYHHHQRFPQEMQQQMQPQGEEHEAALPAGMPTGGGGGASASAAPAIEADDAATTTQGWWPQAGDEYSYFPQQGLQLTPRGEAAYYPPHEPSGGAAYYPLTPVGDFGGYGYIGEGGLGGLGGYGSWGSFGGWGHGL